MVKPSRIDVELNATAPTQPVALTLSVYIVVITAAATVIWRWHTVVIDTQIRIHFVVPQFDARHTTLSLPCNNVITNSGASYSQWRVSLCCLGWGAIRVGVPHRDSCLERHIRAVAPQRIVLACVWGIFHIATRQCNSQHGASRSRVGTTMR